MYLEIYLILILIIKPSDSNVVLEIFNVKYIKAAAILNCVKSYEQLLDQKVMINSRIKSVFINNKTKIDETRSYFKSAVVLNASCENWINYLDARHSKSRFRALDSLVIITKNLTDTIKVLSLYPIEVDSDVTIVFEEENNYYQLYDIYNTGFYNEGRINVEEIELNDTKMRADMTGVVLKCTSVIINGITLETLDEYLDRSVHTYSYVDSLHRLKYFTLLKFLRDMYHFSYKLSRTNSWGYLRNGSFDGMCGALQRGEIDIGGSPLFFRADRYRVMDYTINTWESRHCFMFRHPKRLGAFYTVYTRPLGDNVWYCTLGFLIIFISTLFLMLKVNQQKVTEVDEDPDDSCSAVVLTTLGAFCQQGVYINRSAVSIRMVVYVIFIFTVNLYQFYNASIVSSLLMESPKDIRTLDDLLKSPLKAGTENALYDLDYFRRTTDPKAKEIYLKKIDTGHESNILDAADGMELVKQGGYAFHVDTIMGYKLMRESFNDREICELQEVQLFPPQKMVSVVKKDLPHRELIAYGLRRMHESGLMQRLKLTWDATKPKCMNTPDSSVFNVSLHEFAMALVVLMCGATISILVLLCEILTSTIDKKRKILPFRN